MSRSRCRGGNRCLRAEIAVEPVPQSRPAGLPLPRRTDPRLVEHRGYDVAVIARQVDVDLGDFAPAGPRHCERIDLFAAHYPGIRMAQRVVEALHDRCTVSHEPGLMG